MDSPKWKIPFSSIVQKCPVFLTSRTTTLELRIATLPGPSIISDQRKETGGTGNGNRYVQNREADEDCSLDRKGDVSRLVESISEARADRVERVGRHNSYEVTSEVMKRRRACAEEEGPNEEEEDVHARSDLRRAS